MYFVTPKAKLKKIPLKHNYKKHIETLPGSIIQPKRHKKNVLTRSFSCENQKGFSLISL